MHERLQLPIDKMINWFINKYNGETNATLEAKLVGRCHDVSIDIGDVEIKLPVFMIERGNFRI